MPKDGQEAAMGEKKNEEAAKILIVDDLEINVGILENMMQSAGYETLCALNVKEALEIMNETMPNLILSDYYMPDASGLDFCRLLQSNPKTRGIPFMFITVSDNGEDKRLAFEAGAVDYIPKPFERVEVLMRVQNQLNSQQAKRKIEENNRRMHKVITEQQSLVEKEQENLLSALIKVYERRFGKTKEDLEDIGYNCKMLARSLQLSPQYEDKVNDEYVELIYTAAKLFDLGSLVLPGEMADAGSGGKEPEYLKDHTEQGLALLDDIKSLGIRNRCLEMAQEIVKYHHAAWDGSGIPSGIAGDKIPLEARIAALVIGYGQAVKSCRGLEDAEKQAEKILREKSGTWYEPYLVDVLLKIRKQLRASI